MKKLSLVVFIAVLSTFKLCAQQDTTSTDTKEVFSPIDVSAEFPGGMAKFYKYIDKNMKFKEIFEKQGVKGNVMVEFVVIKDGSIPKDSVKVIKGLNKLADDEAVRLIQGCPNWIPPQQNGRPVMQRLVLPIKFG